jgi:hypothetical protein
MNETVPTDSNEAVRRFGTVELLIAIAALFISMPFIEPLDSGPIIESTLVTIVFVSGVVAIADRRRTVIVAVILAVPAVIGRWLHDYRPDVVPPELFLVAAILLILFVIVNLLRFVLIASSVNTQVLCASISAYLLLGFLWTLAYWLVAELVPNAFAFNGPDTSLKGFNGLYFSFITMSTVGYGDITPVAKVARMLAASEAVTGSLYIAVLIARLVTLHAASKAS